MSERMAVMRADWMTVSWVEWMFGYLSVSWAGKAVVTSVGCVAGTMVEMVAVMVAGWMTVGWVG